MAAQLRRLGRYEIVDKLAHGGMAELFVAQLPGVEGFAKRVVVKRVLPALAHDRAFVDMFIAEARLAATLDHQNIVQVHDIGHDTDGYFFAMELLHGADLGEILRTTQGAWPLGLALEVVRNACAGLHYAHERTTPSGASLGLVHRDVSPQNIFVTFDGAVKLLDWGIAKAVQQIANQHTRSGTLRGKVPYMSPEQCRGEALDRRSDIFSLAIVLWETTVGERLFGAGAQGEFETLKQIIETDAPRPSSRKPDYPVALERIVMKGLARDVRARYQTADELQVELEAFMRASGTWVTTRELSAFMVRTFPARAGARAAKPDGGKLVPFPRVTQEVPPSPETAELPIAEVVVRPPPVAPRGRRWPIAVLAAGVVAALVLAFLAGRQTSPRAPAAAPPSPATTPPATTPPAPVGEDAHWFQPDDYLVARRAYTGDRLSSLRVGKMLQPPARAGDPAHFVDGTGKEYDSAAFWSTRVATPADLVIGRLAFCMAASYERTAKPPASKADARRGSWTLAKITDVADVAAGQVTVGDVVCKIAGVRVVRD